MPIPFTTPSAGVTQPTYDQLGNKLGVDLLMPPTNYGTDYSGSGALTFPGVKSDPWGYNTTMTNIISDPYNLNANNFSGLNSDQQATAKTVQNAFTRSLQQHARDSARYSSPMLQSYGEDAALAQANTTASLINSNAQAAATRNAYLDAVNKSPTTMQNLAGLISLLGGGLNLANQSGLLGLIKQALGSTSAGTPNSGTSGQTPNVDTSGSPYGDVYDANGQVIGTKDQYGNTIPSYPRTPASDPTLINPGYDYGDSTYSGDFTIPESGMFVGD